MDVPVFVNVQEGLTHLLGDGKATNQAVVARLFFGEEFAHFVCVDEREQQTWHVKPIRWKHEVVDGFHDVWRWPERVVDLGHDPFGQAIRRRISPHDLHCQGLSVHVGGVVDIT